MALKVILDTRFYFSYYNPESRKIADWSKSVVQKISKGQITAASSTITITELYNTMGKILGTDAIIAATALIHAKGVAVTDDEHFKTIKGIKVKWLKDL
jgi:hypothetical protein